MKKLLSMLLVLAMVLTLGLAVSAAPLDNTDAEAESYLWLENTADNVNPTQLAYRIDASAFEGKSNFRIFASVKFEDFEIVGGDNGCIFLNLYFFNEAGDILRFEDWADSRKDPTPGEWRTWEYTFDVSDLEGFAYASVGIGFWQATGKVSVAPINISSNKEMFWNKSFSGPLDIEDPEIFDERTFNIDAANEGICFDTVYPQVDSVGHNLCLDDGVDITILKNGVDIGHTYDDGNYVGIYSGNLQDGIIGAPKFVPEWYGFNPNNGCNSVSGKIDDMSGSLGVMLVTLPEEQEFKRVRLYWYAGEGGIGYPLACRAYYSNDLENWEEFGDLLFECSNEGVQYGWADTEEKGSVSAKYIKVEYLFGAGAWGMVSELEVIAASEQVIDDPSEAPSEVPSEQPSEAPSEAPVDPSSKPDTPVTADNGFVALAIISCIAVAGAVIVKKVR